MATIVARKRADGTTGYTAQIRLMLSGKTFSESRTFAKRALAKDWASEREEQIRRDPASVMRADHRGVTIGALIDRYVDDRAAVEALGRSKAAHLRFLRSHELAEVPALALTSQRLVAHVQARRAGGTGASTVNNDLIWLRVVFRYARTALGMPLDRNVIDDAAAVCRAERMTGSSNKRTRRPSDEELQRLAVWFHAPRSERFSKIPMYLIMWFAIYSCRRMSEIFSLRLGDFDREHMVWLVRDVKNPGGSAGNHMEMLVTPRLLPVIDAIVAGVPRADDRLLPFNAKTVGTYWGRHVKMCGIEDLHFHDLRHEGCSRLAEDGMTIPEIQQVSLHESWGSLQVYVNLRRRRSARVEVAQLCKP